MSAATARRSSATSFITCCRSIIRTGISQRIPTFSKRASAAAACWTIARRPAHWFFPATSASRSPAISRKPNPATNRASDCSATRGHFGEPLGCGIADDDVVDRKLAAVAGQGAVEFALRYRRHFGHVGPGVALIGALEDLAVGVDGKQRRTARPRFDGERAEQGALAVRQTAE